MAQVSYGTITITDTNDIERIYTVYAKSNTNTDVPTAAASNWKESISEAPGSGNYIWQRTVVQKSGTSEKTYSDPVCLTGEEGTDGKGITSITIKYGTSANWNTQPSNWYDDVPEYSSGTPNYWTQTIINYTSGNPTVKVTQDKALTQAVYDSAMANSIAQSANENANGALSQSEQALRRVQAKYGASSTAAATAAKVAACEGFELFNGAEVFIQFTNKNTVANPTLNVNNTGAKSIKDSDGNNLAEQFYWKDNSLVHFVYDGTNWRILDIVTTEKYNNLVSDIDGVSSTVGQHTEQISGLGTRVSTNETNISQTATSITSLVSNQDTYTAPDGTTKTNTIKSAIKQNADNISLRVEKNGVIAAINASTESSGGSAVKISADKVNIEGAAIFTSGRLSTTNLENTIDGRIPEIPDDLSDLSDDTGIIPDVSKTFVSATTLYYASNSTTVPSKPTSHVSTNNTSTRGQWNIALPTYDASYPYLYICTEYKTKDNTYSWTSVEQTSYSSAISAIKTNADAAIKSQVNLYYASNSTTPPSKPTAHVTTNNSSSYGVWNIALPTYSASYPYLYTCKETLTNAGTYGWTTVEQSTYAAATAAIKNIADAAAPKSSAVAKTQQIYYRSNSSTKPTVYPTAWVTAETNKWNNGNVSETDFNGWRRKVTPISDGTGANVTKYLYLWTATQKQLVDGTVVTLTANDIALDDSTTVIDGGKIITGSVTANQLNAADINASNSLTIGALTTTTQNNILNSELADDIANAEANASYSVEIKVTAINYVANTATLVAIPYYQGSTTIPSGVTLTYTWYKDSISSSNIVGSNSNTLSVTNTSAMGLDHNYICVISKP